MNNDSNETLRLHSPEHLGARRIAVVERAVHNIAYVLERIPVPAPAKNVRIPLSEDVRRHRESLRRQAERSDQVKDLTIERLSQQVANLAESNPLFPAASESRTAPTGTHAVEMDLSTVQNASIDELSRQAWQLAEGGSNHVS